TMLAQVGGPCQARLCSGRDHGDKLEDSPHFGALVSRRSAAIALFIAVWLSGCSRASSAADPAGWPTPSPAAASVNGAVLDSIDSEITRGDYGYVDRMLVIRGGKIVFDKSYHHDYNAAYGDSAKVPSALNASDPTGSYNYFNPWW